MSDFSKYSSRYSYYWSENKIALIGFVTLPVLACLLIAIVDDYSSIILGQKLSSVLPLSWLFVIMGLGSLVIYNLYLSAIHPSYLFKSQPDFSLWN
jgi:hypothetical protein